MGKEVRNQEGRARRGHPGAEQEGHPTGRVAPQAASPAPLCVAGTLARTYLSPAVQLV